MKILDILEARYYGKPSVDDVVKRLRQLMASGIISGNLTDIAVDAPTKHEGGMYARFIVRGAKTKEDVRYKIRHYLKHHNIPYSRIYDVVRHSLPNDLTPTTRWTAIMLYELDDLTEAKYAGRWSVIDVANRLNHKLNRVENVMVSDVKIVSDLVVAHLNVEAYSRQDAATEVRRYLKKFGIPHTKIDYQELHTNAWVAILTYDGAQQGLTEARYYGKHSVEDVVERLKQLVDKTPLLSDVWVRGSTNSDGIAYANFSVVGAESREHVETMIEQFLERYGVPYTEIFDIIYKSSISGSSRWEATIEYNPKGLTEARYYRNPTLEQVVGRLTELSQAEIPGDVWIHDPIISGLVKRKNGRNVGGDVVYSDFTVHAKSAQDVKDKVERFLKKYDVPYTSVFDIFSHPQGLWTAVMSYDPQGITKHDGAQSQRQ